MTPKHKNIDSDLYSDILKKKLWTARDISVVLDCSRQRVYEYAEIYRWKPVNPTPRLWDPSDVLKDRKTIFDRRGASPKGWLAGE